jgi:hypothetical protein
MYSFTILNGDEEIGFGEADSFEDAKEYARDELTFSCLASSGVISQVTGPLYF